MGASGAISTGVGITYFWGLFVVGPMRLSMEDVPFKQDLWPPIGQEAATLCLHCQYRPDIGGLYAQAFASLTQSIRRHGQPVSGKFKCHSALLSPSPLHCGAGRRLSRVRARKFANSSCRNHSLITIVRG